MVYRVLERGWRWTLMLAAIGWMTSTAAAWAQDAAPAAAAPAVPAAPVAAGKPPAAGALDKTTRSVIEMQRAIPTADPAENIRERVATGAKVDEMVQKAGAGEAPQVYVVKKGDTLWDISARFLNDPFQWKLVQQNNPQIVNPDLIYPNEPITVYPREIGALDGEGVAEAQPAAEQQKVPEAAEQATAEAVVTEEVASAEVSEEQIPEPEVRPDTEKEARQEYFQQFEKKAEVKVFDAAAVELLSKKRAVTDYDKTKFVYPRAGTEGVVEFVDKSFVKSAGVILAQEDELKFDRLSNLDVVYINRGSDHGVAPGHRFWVVRDDGPIKHPKTGELLGNVFRSVGIIQVRDVRPSQSTAIVKVAYEEISPGNEKLYGLDKKDYVIPYYKPQTEFPIKVSEKPVEAMLVGTQGKVMGILPKMLIYLDKGTRDGLEAGALLNISRPNRKVNDPELEGRTALPDIPIGEAIVVRATDHTATAYVTYLHQEAYVQDRVVTTDNSMLFKRPSALLETSDPAVNKRVYESQRATENPYIP